MPNLTLSPAWTIDGHEAGSIVVLCPDRVPVQMIRDAVQSRLELDELRAKVARLEAEKQDSDERRVAAERKCDALQAQVDGAMLAGMRLIADAWAGANRTAAEWRRWEAYDSPDKILSRYAPESSGPELRDP